MQLWRSFSSYEKALVLLFALTLPFVHPQVDNDGVGYYAYVRSLVVDHNLDFKGDWPDGPPAVTHTDRFGHIVVVSSYTATGHPNNHYSIGPAILWAPFLMAAHLAVLAANHLGGHIPADGFSRPYLITMAVATALYGFLALWLSFRLARNYVAERWAFLATLGMWFGSSLVVYMYACPSWSHAHSAFVVALFLWYWRRTRGLRTLAQWTLLGAIAGLMMDVYYVNAVMLLVPALESLAHYRRNARDATAIRHTLLGNALFAGMLLLVLLPTPITKKVVYGSYLQSGYDVLWFWNSPAFFKIFFSGHGLFTVTPIVILAVAGLFLFWRYDRSLGIYLAVVFLAFSYVMGSYEWWDGIISFGNRFFVSLTPLFVIGLATAFSEFAKLWEDVRNPAMRIGLVLSALILWNLGLAFQWSVGLLPSIGPVYWQEVLYNQFRVAPATLPQAIWKHLSSL